MKTIKRIRELYKNNTFKESSESQIIFTELFKELGYSDNDIHREELINGKIAGVEESLFDNNKFVDFICDDIILEVKSPSISINNKESYKQVFTYNMNYGKNKIGVTNFKQIRIYEKNIKNLILDLDLIRDDMNEITNKMFKVLGKYVFPNIESYANYDTNIKYFKEQETLFKKCFEIFERKQFVFMVSLIENSNEPTFHNSNPDYFFYEILRKAIKSIYYTIDSSFLKELKNVFDMLEKSINDLEELVILKYNPSNITIDNEKKPIACSPYSFIDNKPIISDMLLAKTILEQKKIIYNQFEIIEKINDVLFKNNNIIWDLMSFHEISM